MLSKISSISRRLSVECCCVCLCAIKSLKATVSLHLSLADDAETQQFPSDKFILALLVRGL